MYSINRSPRPQIAYLPLPKISYACYAKHCLSAFNDGVCNAFDYYPMYLHGLQQKPRILTKPSIKVSFIAFRISAILQQYMRGFISEFKQTKLTENNQSFTTSIDVWSPCVKSIAQELINGAYENINHTIMLTRLLTVFLRCGRFATFVPSQEIIWDWIWLQWRRKIPNILI